MATNPRKGKSKNTDTDKSKEDKNMSDTATEAPEATEAPKAEKPQVDHEANLYTAIIEFASDGEVTKLQEAYREVPVAARGKAQGIAMKRAMSEGGVDMDLLSKVLDAFGNLPTASKSRSSRPAIDEGTLQTIRLAGLMVAYETLRQEYGDEAHEAAREWFTGGAPDEHEAAVLKAASNAAAAAQKGTRGGGGSRSSLKEKLPDLIARGALSEGDVLKGANGAEATVNSDGSVTTAGENFTNLSAAARAHRTGKDGKPTSTNGWDFWTLDGKPVGELRQS